MSLLHEGPTDRMWFSWRPKQSIADKPSCWSELDGKKKVVMVTQGTMDNKDLSELMKPAISRAQSRQK